MWRGIHGIRTVRALIAWSALVALAGVPIAFAMPDAEFEVVSPLLNKDSGKNETAVGDLVTDAIRSVLNTDIAIVTSSELKPKDEAVPVGKASSAILADLVSYADDPLSIMELDGASIRAALERAVTIYPQPNMAFLQVSGLQFKYNASSPVGERVTSIAINGKSISDDTRYKVGLTNSLANGALGYWKVWSQNDTKTKVPDMTLVKALDTYLKNNPKVDYSTLDRITVRSK